MATIESVGLALQLVNNFHGLVRDMRDNASRYAASERPDAEVSAVMVADADAYLARVQWVTAVLERNLSGVTAALGVFGISVSDTETLMYLLASVADHTKTASLATSADIAAEAAYILSAVPDYERIY